MPAMSPRPDPNPAGYSGTPLVKKLGIKAESRVALLRAPARFEDQLVGLPEGVTITRGLRGTRDFDVICCFAKREKPLREQLPQAIDRLADRGGLWIAWPKKSSGVATELSDGLVREIGLETGLVDNKVCAIDIVWSGLRFVRRLRKSSPSRGL